MNTYPRLLALLLLLTNIGPAIAASFVDITVTGRVTPDACHVTLSDEGTVDHGKIPSHTLSSTEFTVLPSRLLELNVQCSRPMLFALVGLDNRAESSLAPGFFYGLGRNIHVPAERLGSVALSYRNPMGDAQTLQVLASTDSGETWSPEPNAYPKSYIGFAPPGDRQPDFIGQLTTQLRIDTSINFTQYLTLDQEVPLDGSIVLDLRYL
ncbi:MULTISPECIES: DUF1120 domain-containing protein [Pseudomonas]|uniref:DUF1120 domain-containing protein n=1 Tax=Pseudomonas gessardii TaxID=78544 RepID=A0ABS9FH38_9PSED|nr:MULTISPECIES: DUF1120 domain-containing protein [Pseudomonas]MBH3424803.1 DUF1120 domain-containing protein [Pseudomonas gessardii]MCF4981363.1 DUF1120 domain-containing protein [Pseudomonas gessardii]MCF4989863.1 DUF1120 domain-containing protein [Pseudomonas gessardii]MCF5086873.1 DUF1120 domain-containing protein [Pseudomonas gessardii]MCF5096601.1 DUF1120 domain-containing protein [Pseudomonas gessardii]